MYRVFDNPNQLSSTVIKNRSSDQNLQAYPYTATYEDLSVRHYVAVDSTLTDADIETLLSTPITVTEQTQASRKANALESAMLAAQFKTATSQEAVDYVVQQIAGGTTEAQALAALDAAGTFAAAKPIIRNMLIGMYRTVDILKLVARILVAVRDELWSNLPEKN